MTEDFLPVCREDMEERGIGRLDFVYVTGDAYVDHPSFGPAVISRVLDAHGYRVGILSQPDWKDEDSIRAFGRPRLGFLVSAGNMDSMVNHYYVSKKRRQQDAYTPGGEAGKRPDRATIVYCGLIRRAYGDVPVIIGGIEASLRRLAHYDYWSDSLRRSILLDSQADLLSYGMGERAIVEIADALDSGLNVKDLTFLAGTVYRTRDISGVYGGVLLPSYTAIKESMELYAESFGIQYQNTDPFNGKTLIEPYPDGFYAVQNPPQKPLTQQEMDDIYELPYRRAWHPAYDAKGGVPAFAEVRFSLTSSRGCFGGCSFCALTFHQGRIVQARSHASLLQEALQMTKEPGFKGYIHDVGGPTANFRAPACEKQLVKGTCRHRQCLYPAPCRNLRAEHSDYLTLLRSLRKLPGVKKVFIRSGIRFDYLLADPDPAFLQELVQYHVSGQLKVAPEHISDTVLARMGKPGRAVYEAFRKRYEEENVKSGLRQYLVPYFMSSHPGSTLKEAVELAEYLRDTGCSPEQVQDFYPTPSTVSTVMYATGLDPLDLNPVYVCRSPHEKAMQRALIQYRNPANYELVREALLRAGRQDLIGFEKHCLIRPRKLAGEKAARQTDRAWRTERPERRPKGSGPAREGKRRPDDKRAGAFAAGNPADRKTHAGSGRPAERPAAKIEDKQRRAGKTIRQVHKKKG